MTRAGDVFENPRNGDRTVVRAGSEDTNDEYVVIEHAIQPGGAVIGVWAVRRAALAILVPIARARGYRGKYERYTNRRS